MMNEYNPEQKITTKWDVLTAWIMAAAVVAAVAAFGPEVNVDMDLIATKVLTSLFSG